MAYPGSGARLLCLPKGLGFQGRRLTWIIEQVPPVHLCLGVSPSPFIGTGGGRSCHQGVMAASVCGLYAGLPQMTEGNLAGENPAQQRNGLTREFLCLAPQSCV